MSSHDAILAIANELHDLNTNMSIYLMRETAKEYYNLGVINKTNLEDIILGAKTLNGIIQDKRDKINKMKEARDENEV